MLINISGGRDLTLHEVAEAARIIADAVDPDANIISGMVIDETLEDEMKVTVIATGFRLRRRRRRAGRADSPRAAPSPAAPGAGAPGDAPPLAARAAPPSRGRSRPSRAQDDVPFYRKASPSAARRRPGRLRPQLVERRRLRHPDRAAEADGLSGAVTLLVFGAKRPATW